MSSGVSPAITSAGQPQAMSRRCATCILQPGGSSLVPPAVVRDLIDRHRAVGAVVTCHQTLPDIPGSTPELGYSACRGFLDAYPDIEAARLVPFLGGWHLVDPLRLRAAVVAQSTPERCAVYDGLQPPRTRPLRRATTSRETWRPGRFATELGQYMTGRRTRGLTDELTPTAELPGMGPRRRQRCVGHAAGAGSRRGPVPGSGSGPAH